MGISYRSSYEGSGGDINTDSFYAYCGNTKWLPGQYVNASNFTSPVTLGENFVGVVNMFAGSTFNQEVVFTNNNIEVCGYMFCRAYRYNLPTVIPNNTKWCWGMFSETWNFNQSVNVPDSVISISGMFYDARAFNSSVNIGNNTKYCNFLFYNTWNYNQPVTIPNGVTHCNYMFYHANKFNQTIIIPDSVVDCYSMFAGATFFNSPVTIGTNVVNCGSMFASARNFNQPITIPNGVTNCSAMFASLENFNQTIIIPDSVVDCNHMFNATYNMNSSIIVGKNVEAMCNFLGWQHTGNFYSDVYIRSTNSALNTSKMLRAFNCVKGIRLHFNSVMNNVFNTKSLYIYLGSGKPGVSWTDMSDGNGFYNSAYNIYCYNNYVVS